MKTRSLLVYVPGVPLEIGAFCPQRRLAALAGALLQEGHETQVLDWGSAGALGSLGTPGLRAFASRAWNGAESLEKWGGAAGWRRLLGLRERTPWERLAEEAATRRSVEVVSAIEAYADLDFVLFLINSRRDLLATFSIAERLSVRRPEIRRIASGPFMDDYGAAVLSSSKVFHGVCVGDAEVAVDLLADRITRPERWNAVPNLLYSDQGRIARTPRDGCNDLGRLPVPVYDTAIYPAMQGGKFKLFTLEQSRGSHHVSYGCAEVPWSARQVRVKPVEALCREIDRLSADFGARVFHFAGDSAPATQVDRLGAELFSRYEQLVYSRDGNLAYSDPDSFRALAASGCTAMNFRLDTGSQRLLEDFYGHNFGVSQAEAVLNACRAANVFAQVLLTYPCPMDDHHTVAETLRILKRVKPHAASVLRPSVPPGSVWRDRAAEFGFLIAEKHRPQWGHAAPPKDRWTIEYGAEWGYRMRGWTSAQAEEATHALHREAQELGVYMGGGGPMGLLARVSGFEGREPEFIEEASRALFACDAASLSGLVDTFNVRAIRPANTIPFRSFAPIRVAVGN